MIASVRRAGLAALMGAAMAGCDSKILEVTDPDIINPEDLGSAVGAEALRNGALTRLQAATSGESSDNVFLFGGMLADEWRSGDTFEQRNTTDQRSLAGTPRQGLFATSNSFIAPQFRAYQRIRDQAQQAIVATRATAPAPLAPIGLMFALKAYAAVTMGEYFCNGIPFSRAEGPLIIPGNPVSVDSAFKIGVSDADSATANNDATGTAATDVRNLALVIKARALLDRNLPASISGLGVVATTWIYKVNHSANTSSNNLWSLNTNAKRYVLGNQEGGVGLNYRSANDPRLPTSAGGNAFDSQTPFIAQLKWARYDPVTIVSGVEARLIEAEVQWRTDTTGAVNRVTVTNQLNAIRATAGLLPAGAAALAPLAVPATPSAMLDLIMRERAFWMFSTGHRLGDLRRLVKFYGRAANTVYPNGAFPKGGTYGNFLVMPLPDAERNNANFNGCTDLNP